MSERNLNDQNRFFRLASETADPLFVRRFEGQEGISQLYRFDVELYAERELKIESYIGTDLIFELNWDEPEANGRLFGGTVMAFGCHGISPEADLPIYRATIEPWLAYLTRRSDCRVFQSKSVVDICEEVFTRAGFEAATHFDLGNIVREKRDQCVQYQETDFAFVSRLLEEEGIAYHFETTKEGVILQLSDGSFRSDLGLIRPRTGEGLQVIQSLSFQQTVHSGRAVTTAFNFEDPASNLEASSDTILQSLKRTGLEFYDYPGLYSESSKGKEVAERRMQELESAAQQAIGESLLHRFGAGQRFTLSEHPIESLNQEYLLTSVGHRIEQRLRESETDERDSTPYANTFTAVPTSDTVYRPPRVTPRPKITGSQTAIVVGPRGEEIHTDPHGRVKVRFHWDRWGAKNDSDLQEWDSSCWVRVAQASAGKGWGSFFLPRVGQEVVVEFLDGDPDRPIVTGTLYNGKSRLPYDTTEKDTISGIKTLTVGGQGFNELRFDDQPDEEQIFIHAQKNLDVRILNDSYEVVKNNRHQLVEKDRLLEVRNESHETIAKDHRVKIGKDHHLYVGGKQAIEVKESRSLKVTEELIEEVGGNHSEKVSGDLYLKGTNVVIEASTALTLKVGGSSVVVDSTGVTAKGGLVTIDGSMVKIASGPGSSPGSGSAGSRVTPADPTRPEEADEADPGEVDDLRREQREKEKGKYGNPAWVAPPPFPDGSQNPEDDPTRTWIAIKTVGEDDEPIAGIAYEIEDCEGRLYHGTTGPDGQAKEYVKKGGDPKVRFPKHDEEAIEKQ